MEEIGHCSMVKVAEIGDTSVIVFKQGKVEWLNCKPFKYMSSSSFASVFPWLAG